MITFSDSLTTEKFSLYQPRIMQHIDTIRDTLRSSFIKEGVESLRTQVMWCIKVWIPPGPQKVFQWEESLRHT